ncbi:MAG: tetratricopeptide repeat protein [Bacteroidetes bacterium]|nr:tetratricopeptide repeat protein [Bacteroidota bacterium]
METLKRTIAVGFIAFFITNISFAQNYKEIQDAFALSYQHETKAEYPKAIDALKKVYDEKSYEINLRLGWLTYMSGLFTESSAYYQKAIKIMPLSIEAKLGFVNPAAALGNWEQVKTQYIEILKTDPKNYTANYRMGLIFYGKKNYMSAVKYYETLTNLYPFDYDSMIMYAWCNYFLQKTREAKVLFNKTLMNKPNDASALEGLSLIK